MENNSYHSNLLSDKKLENFAGNDTLNELTDLVDYPRSIPEFLFDILDSNNTLDYFFKNLTLGNKKTPLNDTTIINNLTETWLPIHARNIFNNSTSLGIFDSFVFNYSENLEFNISKNISQNTTEIEENNKSQHPVLWVLLVICCLLTAFGNILVMVAVAKERYLRSVTNYFIVSLAVADFLVGIIVMPFGAVLEMMYQYWPFGHVWCDLWRSCDVLASTASILNLCVISLDRYWAITDPITYPSKMSPRRACYLIALVWICSSLISFPAIAWWNAVKPPIVPENTCPFTDDLGYLICSSLISFYVPLVIMVFTYYKIYKAATEQTKGLKSGRKKLQCRNGVEGTELTLRIHRGGGGNQNANRPLKKSNAFRSKRLPKDFRNIENRENLTRLTFNEDDTDNPSKLVSKRFKHFSLGKKFAKIAKEQKAAKTLGIVMGVFIICWLPFFVTNVLLGVCYSCVWKPEILFPMFTWLGFINSLVNPIIYALSSRDFRRAFIKVLCSCCPGLLRNYYLQNYRSRFKRQISNSSSFSCNTTSTTVKL